MSRPSSTTCPKHPSSPAFWRSTKIVGVKIETAVHCDECWQAVKEEGEEDTALVSLIGEPIQGFLREEKRA